MIQDYVSKRSGESVLSLVIVSKVLFYNIPYKLCGINQAELCFSCNMCFLMKGTRISDMPTGFWKPRIVYLLSFLIIFLIFETYAMRVTITCKPDFSAYLMGTLPVRNVFSTYKLSRKIVYQVHKRPQLEK